MKLFYTGPLSGVGIPLTDTFGVRFTRKDLGGEAKDLPPKIAKKLLKSEPDQWERATSNGATEEDK